MLQAGRPACCSAPQVQLALHKKKHVSVTQKGVLYNNGDWEHVLCSIVMKTTVESLETEGRGLKVKIKR